MREELEKQLARFEELERMMTDPVMLSDSRKAAAIAREHGTLAKVATKYRRFKQLLKEIADVKQLLASTDPDERAMAETELVDLKAKREELWNELLESTIGGEDANRSRCIMEIRAGTGGEEAALFARNLYEMYRKYAEGRRWKVEVLDSSPTELGGFKEIIAGVRRRAVSFARCNTKAADIACSECRRPKPRGACIRRRQRSPCCRSRKMSKSI